MAYLPGKFVWFEHVSGDVRKARAFYEPLCGWTTGQMPMGEQSYDIITNDGQAIGGYRAGEAGTPAHWASYLSVPDVDGAFKAATKAGAKALSDPMDYGPVGRAAVISDPTGALVSLWKGAQDDPADVARAPVGAWFWNELWTSDTKAAVAFYEKALGFTHDTMDMGPQGTYYILKDAAGAMRAGMMQMPPGSPMPSNWLTYIHVADCDAAGRKAMQMGAIKTIVPPTDIPNIGRFTVLIDPLGAPVGLIKGAG